MSVKIVCDSTSYIPKKLIEKYDIKIVSLNIIMGSKAYKEVNMDTLEFYDLIRQADKLPTSSQPDPSEILSCFEEIIKKGDDILGVFLSSEMSGTYSTACMIKEQLLEKYPAAKISILDSKSNCMQLGFSALSAAKAAYEGHNLEECRLESMKVMETSKFLFVPDTLEYLKKGGRIGGAAALIGAILQIRPILTVFKGKTCVFDKVRTKHRAVQRIIDVVVEEVNQKGLGGIIVHHINAENEGRKLADTFEKLLGIPVDICSIGAVIGLHVGPGAVGVVYYTKE